MLDLSGLKQTLSSTHISQSLYTRTQLLEQNTIYNDESLDTSQRQSTAHGFRATQVDSGSRFSHF